uniref:Uncharacterized protein n=1 Tax=Schistocephalus solidus TaxID=70667 RepID=A0A0X3PN79_SCHSO
MRTGMETIKDLFSLGYFKLPVTRRPPRTTALFRAHFMFAVSRGNPTDLATSFTRDNELFRSLHFRRCWSSVLSAHEVGQPCVQAQFRLSCFGNPTKYTAGHFSKGLCK